MKRPVARRLLVLVPGILAFAWMQQAALRAAPPAYRAAGLALVAAQLATHAHLLRTDGRCSPSEGSRACNALAGIAGAAHLLLLSRSRPIGPAAAGAAAVASYMVASHLVTLRPLDPFYGRNLDANSSRPAASLWSNTV